MSQLLTPDEAAERVRRPKRTLDQWRYLGFGPAYVKVGRRVMYDEADVVAWLEANKINPAAAAPRGA